MPKVKNLDYLLVLVDAVVNPKRGNGEICESQATGEQASQGGGNFGEAQRD